MSLQESGSIGVLICSYRRVEALARCLEALAAQERRPDDVIVVVRADDGPTHDWLATREADGVALRTVQVTHPGTVHALNAGLDACWTDILAITDDDTAARPDWLRRIFDHFRADSRLGALGGRDRCHDGDRFDDREAEVVGRIAWYGRAIGNHHAGTGGLRDVDYLKGANMSYRARAFTRIRFDRRLRGVGAQPYEDAAFSLAVGRAGWRIRYDPRVLVHHYAATRAAVRHYSVIGPVTDPEGLVDYAYNNVVAYWDGMTRWRRIGFAAWSVLVGMGTTPGLLQALRFTPSLGRASWLRFVLTQRGKLQAARDLAAVSRRDRPSAGIAAQPVGAGCDRQRAT